MTIRKAKPGDAAGIAQVHVESWQETYGGIVSDSAMKSRTIEQRRALWQQIIDKDLDAKPLFVAEANGTIVGFVSGGAEGGDVEGYDAELYAIYLLQSAQGQGIGRKLAERIAGELQAMGFQSMVLWVLADNERSRGFYEHLGGTVVKEGVYRLGKETYNTVAYGWPDIRTLIARKKD